MIIALAIPQFGMSRKGQYDEEARQAEKEAKQARKLKNPATGIASGVKEVAYDGTKGFLSDTANETREDPLLVGTLEGARKGSGKILDSTVKGAVKVATLGQGDLKEYEVIEPESGSDEVTAIKIKIPGT